MTAVTNPITRHPLIATLRGLQGNVRGVVYTEPLWGIPYNLYAPFVSVYMVALGLSDSQIGLLASIGLGFQVFWTMISGAITDKFGRKRTTFVVDLISWSIPCLIWAIAQDFTYFLVAAIINSTWRITHNSWQCLLVESTEPALLVDVWSLIYISGLVAAFFSPITSLLVASFTLVPTMRGLYLLAFVMMTAKFVIMNAMVTEPEPGIVRMEETRDQSIWSIVRESHIVVRRVLHSPETVLILSLMLIVGIGNMINQTFWAIMVTEKLQVPDQYLPIFYFVKSMTMLVFYFLIMPKLRLMNALKPMLVGFACMILSWTILVNIAPGSYGFILLATVLEGIGYPALSPMLEKLIAINVEPKERSRIMAFLYLIVLLGTTPFGWIGGQMSEFNR
ncbi:MAG: MFS transporter, partial [Caldilineaceae bacterium]